MRILTDRLSLSTRGNDHIIDITPALQKILREHEFTEGNVTVFIVGSTAGITTIEYEPGLIKDLPVAFERIAPRRERYHHDETWHDGNGHSHVRASLLGASLVIPFAQGALLLGTWQQVVVADFDTHPRTREVVVQIIGD